MNYVSAEIAGDREHEQFRPPLWMRPSIVQTGFASFKYRKKGPNPMLDAAQRMVLDVGEGVRLLGSYSPHPNPKGLMILMHGWEGSEESTYVVCGGKHVFNNGYSVFRLNMRDHGDSHHFNEGLFFSFLFDEVYEGFQQAAAMSKGLPVYLAGFSLGGNFVTRAAIRHEAQPIPNLKHTFAISPVINPTDASSLVDKNPLIQRYFKKKWIRSLKKKQTLWPNLYRFDEMFEQKTVMGMTDILLKNYSTFADRESYFNSYRVWPDDLKGIRTPLSLITSKDDPIIPPKDFQELNTSPAVRRILLKYGGHNGFFDSVKGLTWYDRYFEQVMTAGG